MCEPILISNGHNKILQLGLGHFNNNYLFLASNLAKLHSRSFTNVMIYGGVISLLQGKIIKMLKLIAIYSCVPKYNLILGYVYK